MTNGEPAVQPRSVSAEHAQALDALCQAVRAGRTGALTDAAIWRAGLAAAHAVARGLSAGASAWRATLGADPAQRLQVLELINPTADQALRFFLDARGAAYVGAWQTPAAGPPNQLALFDVRADPAAGWVARIGGGQPAASLPLGARPAGFAWTDAPRVAAAAEPAAGAGFWRELFQAAVDQVLDEVQDWAADQAADRIVAAATPRPAAETRACAACGFLNDPASQFCGRCGSKLAPAAAGFCGQCGAPLAAGLKFCTRCGRPVQQEP